MRHIQYLKNFNSDKNTKEMICLVFFFASIFTFFCYLPYRQTIPAGDDIVSISTLMEYPFFFLDPSRWSISFRPIHMIPYTLLVNIFGFNMWGYYLVNVFVHSLIVTLLYKKVSEIANNKALGIVIAFLFSISRFTLYSVVQAEGLMELMCTLFVLIFVSALYDAVYKEDKRISSINKAIIIYTLIIFTHERFILLLPSLLVALLICKKSFKNGKQFTLYLFLCCLPLLFFILVRSVLGIAFFRGTGGVMMAFEPLTGIRHISYHILYMFGIHPDHSPWLNGIIRSDVPLYVNIFVSLSIASVLIVFIIYICIFIRFRKSSDILRGSLNFVVICIFALGGMIISSSFTIHIEQRWVQAPYLVALLLLSYVVKIIFEFISNPMTTHLKTKPIKIATTIIACLVIYLVTTFSYTVFYRKHFEYIFMIHSWHSNAQLFHEEVLIKYRNEIPNASTVVIERHGVFINSYRAHNYAMLYAIAGDEWRDLCFTVVYSIEDVDLELLDKPLLLLHFNHELGTFIPAVNELNDNVLIEGFLVEAHPVGAWYSPSTVVYLFGNPEADSLRFSGFWPEYYPENSLTVIINGNETKTIEILPGVEFEATVEFENMGNRNKVEFQTSTYFDAGWWLIGFNLVELEFFEAQ